MKLFRKLALAASVAGFAVAASNASAQQEPWPSKPVRFVVCCVGIIDASARVLADHISQSIKHNIVVDTRGGASGMLAAEHAAKSKPDGYTFFIGTNSTHAANQSLYTKVPYNYVSDFVPVSGIGLGVIMLVVNPSLPAKNVRELTALAKSRDGKMTFGWGSSSTRAASELYKQLTGVNIVHVPYKTVPQAAADVAGGQIDMMFADMVTAPPLVKAGKLRALAVSGKKRVSALPEVPSMEEAGVPGYELTWWMAAWAPAGTPKDIVAKMNALIAAAISAPKTREFFLAAALEPFPTSSEELMKFQVAEHDKWRRIIKTAGIEPQ